MPEGESGKDNGKLPYLMWKIPFLGVELKFGGREVFTVIIVVAIAIPLSLFMKSHDDDVKGMLKSLVEAQEATTYVLTLSQEDRQKLNLAKPKRIRDMERDR